MSGQALQRHMHAIQRRSSHNASPEFAAWPSAPNCFEHCSRQSSQSAAGRCLDRLQHVQDWFEKLITSVHYRHPAVGLGFRERWPDIDIWVDNLKLINLGR